MGTGLIGVLDKIDSGIIKLKYFLIEKKARFLIKRNITDNDNQQDLDIYWDPSFLEGVNTWGLGTVWTEIQLLLAGCEGRVLDIACGTGSVISILNNFEKIDIYGCDISDLLIAEAVKSGIPQPRLTICDATQMPYNDNDFGFSYSIGSLEHFREDGFTACLNEIYRVTRHTSFHLIPCSRTGENEGWIKLGQSFYNNSVDWWFEKFTSVYKNVYVLDSVWRGAIEKGKWFVCSK